MTSTYGVIDDGVFDAVTTWYVQTWIIAILDSAWYSEARSCIYKSPIFICLSILIVVDICALSVVYHETLLDRSVVAVLCDCMLWVWWEWGAFPMHTIRRIWLSDTTPSSLIALWVLYVIVTLTYSLQSPKYKNTYMSMSHYCRRVIASDGRVVNLPSFLPAVMTSSSSVGVVMSCQWSVAAQ